MADIFLSRIDLLSLQDRRGEALPQAVQLLAHQERIHGEFSAQALNAMETIAEVYAFREEFTEALRFRRRALSIGEKLCGPTDFRRALILSNLASDELRSGLRDDAMTHLEQAIAVAAAGQNPSQADQFRQQLEQLRQPQQPAFDGSPSGPRWFNTDRFSRTDGTRIKP